MKQYELNLLFNPCKQVKNYKLFSVKEINIIKKLQGKISFSRIGERLGRSERSIRSKVFKLKLPKTEIKRRDLWS